LLFDSRGLTITSGNAIILHTQFAKINIYKGKKVKYMESKEELFQFILSLTEEECELIISTIGDTRCTAPQEVMEFNATPSCPIWK
jgi:hypothetical protein